MGINQKLNSLKKKAQKGINKQVSKVEEKANQINPVKIMQRKAEEEKERKRLEELERQRQEALRREEEKKKRMLGFAILGGLFLMLGVLALFEDDTDTSPTNTVEVVTTSKEENEEEDTSTNSIDNSNEQNDTQQEDNNVSSNDIELGIPELTLEDLSDRLQTDYSHYNLDYVYLGNNESAKITLEASLTGLSEDDILIYYDDSILSVEATAPYESNNNTYFNYIVKGKKEGTSKVAFITVYDYTTLGEDANWLVFEFSQLNSVDGRIVYVTPTGDKYHYSQSCAGESAYATTYFEVNQYGMEPCSKCVK